MRTRGFRSSERLISGWIVEDGRVIGTFEVTVVEWETDAVEPKAFEESSIRILEERLKELHRTKIQLRAKRTPHLTCLIEEILRLFLPDGSGEGL